MSRMLWFGLGALAAVWYARRGGTLVGGKSFARHHTPGGLASTAFGAGTASLEPPPNQQPAMASTAFPAGTASLPRDQQVIP